MQALQLTVPFLCTVFIVLMITKAWNMYTHWMWRDSHEKAYGLSLVSFVTHSLFTCCFIRQMFSYWAGYSYYLLFCFYIRKTTYKTNTVGLHNRARRKMDIRFYQFASIFTDVPQLKTSKQQKMAYELIEPLLHKKRATFFYLHTLAFLRGNDYFGIYIRLGLIGAFALYFVPNIYVKGAIAYIVLYMISMRFALCGNIFREILL